MPLNVVVDVRLVGVRDLRELQAHTDPAIGPGDRRLGVDVAFRCGRRKRTLTAVPTARGLVVRIARPPRLMLSVSAAAIVLPKR